MGLEGSAAATSVLEGSTTEGPMPIFGGLTIDALTGTIDALTGTVDAL